MNLKEAILFLNVMKEKENIFHIHYGDIYTKLNSIIDSETKLSNVDINGDLEELEVGDILFAEDYKDLGKTVVIVGNQSKKKWQDSTLIGFSHQL